MEIREASQLIEELQLNPEQFERERIDGKGVTKGYRLLEYFYKGHSVEAMRPLLTHSSTIVRRVAAFIAAEIAPASLPVISQVIPLIRDADGYTAEDAIDCVSICSTGQAANYFVYAVRELESDRERFRELAMEILTEATAEQLTAARNSSDVFGDSALAHRHGLKVLLDGESVSRDALNDMIASTDPLLRKYGAVATKRLVEFRPDALFDLTWSSDEDLQRFSIKAAVEFNDRVEKKWRRAAKNMSSPSSASDDGLGDRTQPLPVLDGTWKLHGPLPEIESIPQYRRQELEVLLDHLWLGRTERYLDSLRYGRDRSHASRQAAEQIVRMEVLKFLGRL